MGSRGSANRFRPQNYTKVLEASVRKWQFISFFATFALVNPYNAKIRLEFCRSLYLAGMYYLRQCCSSCFLECRKT